MTDCVSRSGPGVLDHNSSYDFSFDSAENGGCGRTSERDHATLMTFKYQFFRPSAISCVEMVRKHTYAGSPFRQVGISYRSPRLSYHCHSAPLVRQKKMAKGHHDSSRIRTVARLRINLTDWWRKPRVQGMARGRSSTVKMSSRLPYDEPGGLFSHRDTLLNPFISQFNIHHAL